MEWMEVTQWIQQMEWIQWVEIFGVIFGFFCVVLTVKQNIWCWPVGIVNIILFFILFLEIRLYADVGLHVVYFVLSIYGWYNWLHGGEKKDTLPISRIPHRLAVIYIVSGAAAVLCMGYVLSTYTDADLPYWDSTTTVMCLFAQWMLAKKYLESWVVWVSVDVLYVGIYYYKQVYFTSILYAMFLILATTGYIEWKNKKALEENTATA